jgi:magnesium-transporting ATPase (P-type)
MNQEIATMAFFVLVLITVLLQFIMWNRRRTFLRALETPKSRFEELTMMLEIIIPIKLRSAGNNPQLDVLRKSAVKASIYWMISLLLTFLIPVILFRLTMNR